MKGISMTVVHTRCWRHLDEPGMELLRVHRTAEGLRAQSSLLHSGAETFALSYDWSLDNAWRTRRVHLRIPDAMERSLLIEKLDEGRWQVDGRPRPDLDGCGEVDVSATPFCNSLAIWRMAPNDGEWTALYVAVPALTCVPSRQRYERLGPASWRYIDLGVANGFQARLDLDDEGFVAQYEGLFEALPTADNA